MREFHEMDGFEEDDNIPTAVPYPVDFKEVEKGDTFSINEVERIFGVTFGTDSYRFACMSLIQDIHRWTMHHRRPMRARVVKHAVHIMTDPEASEYGAIRHQNTLSTLAKNHQLTKDTVDVSQLSEGQRSAHLKALTSQASTLLAIRKASRREELTKGTRTQSLVMEQDRSSKV